MFREILAGEMVCWLLVAGCWLLVAGWVNGLGTQLPPEAVSTSPPTHHRTTSPILRARLLPRKVTDRRTTRLRTPDDTIQPDPNVQQGLQAASPALVHARPRRLCRQRASCTSSSARSPRKRRSGQVAATTDTRGANRRDRQRADGDDRPRRDRRRADRLHAVATHRGRHRRRRKGDEPTKPRRARARRPAGIASARSAYSDRAPWTADVAGSQGEATRHWTARLLDMPFGRALVVGVGLGVLGYAAYQMYRAFSDKAKKHLDLAEAGPTRRRGSCDSAASASRRAAWCSR